MNLRVRALVCALALTGCGRNIQNKEAVKEGVMAHLKTRSDIDLTHMDVEVGNVSFRKGEADATVIFKVKGSTDATSSMAIVYTLEEKGGSWAVKGRRSGAEGDPHGPSKAPAQGMPPGHPPTGRAKP